MEQSKQSLFDQWSSTFENACYCHKDVARFMASQAILETGWFTSKIYKENHNLFGMRFPAKRLTLANSKNNGHSVYNSDYESFCDYLLWLQYHCFLQSDMIDIDKFVAKFRKCNFNPSEKYVDTVLKILKTYAYE